MTILTTLLIPLETATSSGTNALGQIRKRINSSNISGHDTSDHTLRIPMEDLEVEDELGQLSAHKVEDLFCDSQLPPIQLPLNHSSQDKQVIRTKKEFPDEDSKMNVDEPVRTNAAGLFTTTDSVSHCVKMFRSEHWPLNIWGGGGAM